MLSRCPQPCISHMQGAFTSCPLSCLIADSMHNVLFLHLSRGIAAAAGLLGPVSHDLQAGVPGDGLLPLQGSANSTATPAAGGTSAASQQQQQVLPHWTMLHNLHAAPVHCEDSHAPADGCTTALSRLAALSDPDGDAALQEEVERLRAELAAERETSRKWAALHAQLLPLLEKGLLPQAAGAR